MRIAVITPISHLHGVKELVETKGKVYYLENGKKKDVRELLLNENIDTIFCNPNKQTYMIDKELLTESSVSLVNTCSTGLSHIDLDYLNKEKIRLYSLTKDFDLINELPSTSELAFGLMVDLLRKITISQEHVKQFNWDYTEFMGRQIKDLNIGILGFGRLGKLMYKYCEAFGANTSVYDPYIEGYNKTPLDEFISNCDVISLHVHLNEQTKNLINNQSLKKCKNSLIIINTSRGGLVNEKEIINKINLREIGGYGSDVLVDENSDITNSKLIEAMKTNKNIIITPHVGGMTIEGQTKAYIYAINKL